MAGSKCKSSQELQDKLMCVFESGVRHNVWSTGWQNLAEALEVLHTHAASENYSVNHHHHTQAHTLNSVRDTTLFVAFFYTSF